MNAEPTTIPQLSQQPADHDEPYTWVRPPSTYLAFRQIVRLTILRSRLREDVIGLDRGALSSESAAELGSCNVL